MVKVFIPNDDWPDEWAQSEDAQELAEVSADAALRHAVGIAPVDEGEYRDGLEAEVTRDEAGRWVGLVIATAAHSRFIEFGTEDTPTFAVLRRSIEAIGAKRRPGR